MKNYTTIETHEIQKMKSSVILKINTFAETKLSSTEPKPFGTKGAKIVGINYKFPDGMKPITIQTPWMISYGINKWEDPDNAAASPKLSVTLSFVGVDSDPKITELKAFLDALDDWVIETGHKHCWEWLGFKGTRETVAINYTRSVKIPLDKKTGEPSGKPANMKLKLSKDKTDYSAAFFTKEKKYINTEDVENYFTMGSKVRAIVQCTGVWVAAGKFGLSWKLKQLIADPSNKIGREFAFEDDEDEEQQTVTPKQQETAYVSDNEEEQEPSVETVPTPDAPKAKIVRRVVAKP